ncbi:MAG: T9SS type A sorting domain-containing protein [Saprospiraceae bacterium]|nr:T9SS type A sorting domain-containing protein [Saprospiraceae bacterium]
MHRVFLFFLVISSFISKAQVKGDYLWVGGYQSNPEGGQKGYMMDFLRNKGEPAYVKIPQGFADNNASICDENGYLLFYFNGCAVMNRFHHVMPNGDSINAGIWFDLYWKDCKYGYPGPQDVLILPDTRNESGYYIFHNTNLYYPQIRDSNQLNFSYVDMTLDGGNGDVIIKNKSYYPRILKMYSYFTAIKHENTIDWWVIKPVVNDSIFLVFSLNENGINIHSMQNTHQFFDESRSSSSGTAKFSPDGKKLALYNYYDQLHIYDFDRSTGLISSHQKVEIYPPDSIDRSLINLSSVEWSPNSRFIYCSSSVDLYQVDTWEDDIQNGVKYIDSYNGTLDPFPTRLFLMAQGPDCKIYMTPKNGSYSLHVINKPDELGTDCDFVQNAIKLPNSNSGTLPNFPRFRVDEEKKCDPSITSLFGETVFYRKDIEVFPNPSNGIFKIKIPELHQHGILSITNIEGKLCFQKNINWTVYEEVDISTLPSGRYNIEFYPDDNKEKIYYGKQVIKL